MNGCMSLDLICITHHIIAAAITICNTICGPLFAVNAIEDRKDDGFRSHLVFNIF